MTDFLLFDSFLLHDINSDPTDTFYELFRSNKWLKLHGLRQWSRSTSARTHSLDTPWTIKNLSPIPDLAKGCDDFATVMDSIVSDYCIEIAQGNRQVYVNWSGGIDSTSLLVAFLKNASSDILDKITVICNADSIVENPYFYYKFVEPTFNIVETYKLNIDKDNYTDIILLDGELGDQCFYGNNYIYQLAMSKQFDLLRSPWKNSIQHCVVKDSKYNTADDSTIKFAMDLIVESLDYSPIEITSLYDFLWWTHFNFKWDAINLRKLTLYTGQLHGPDRECFYNRSLRRVFADARMQQWSMLTLGRRASLLETDVKYDIKNYIYNFDRNDFYFAHRTKLNSGQEWSDESLNFGYRTMAIDDKWTELQLTSRKDRRTIAEILQKITI
jgi:hypothetical protein